jgi:hemerythrin-like metal-binding protein
MTLSFRSPIILTGIPAIDQLHREVAEALARVSLLPADQFCAGYGALLQKMEQAFATEDRWMEEVDYPGLLQHREQHARVLGGLHHAHARVIGGDLALGREVTGELLPAWLELHMATMDIPMAASIRFAGLREDQETSS